MRSVQALLVVVTLAAIAVVVLWEAEAKTAPGPLHPVHAQVADLSGNDGCVRCHGGPGQGEMATACGACHAAIDEQVAAGRGLHGRIDDAGRCGACHVEHHGAEVAPVGDHAFARAGIDTLQDYDHRHVTDFGLAGAHAELACGACHAHADDAVLAAGTARFLGLDQACASCHDDAHDGALGADCARCHGQALPFPRVGAFRHRRFGLDGAHAELRCDACHVRGSPTSIDALTGTDPEPRGCADCHGAAHAPGGTALPLTAAATACTDCHDTRSFERAFGAAEHAAVGAPLDGAHARARCAGCHTPERAAAPRVDVPMARCADCHGTPHAAGGAALPLTSDAGDCARCHDPADAFRRPFDADDHAAAGIELRGAHAAADCAGCHTPARDASGSPAAAMARCADCHASPHRDAFTAAVVATAGGAAGRCAVCHDAEQPGFAGGRLEPGAHAAVGFPLERPHDAVACTECHGAAGEPFERRFPGRDADGCRACHGDPHRGQFDRGDRGGVCVACHARTHFVPSTFGLELHRTAAFALDGAHRAVACGRCHDRPGGEGSPVRFAGVPSACDACHADPHGGAFDSPHAGAARPDTVGGPTGCARCHQTSGFRDLRAEFDHRAWTGYALVGAHARAECAACHGRAERPDASGRTLGRAPAACASCHDDPHAGQFVRAGADGAVANDCARCHRPETDFTDLAFDHDRDTRFALDAAHARLACSACHRPVATRSGRTVVRYRPLGTRCSDCHGGREEHR